MYDDDERLASQAATTMCERGFENLFMLSGGEQSFGLLTHPTPALGSPSDPHCYLPVLSDRTLARTEKAMLSEGTRGHEMSSASVSMSLWVCFAGGGEGFIFFTVGFVDLKF